LDRLLPGYWSRGNPIDLVAAIGSDLAQRALTVLVESELVDAVAVLGILNSPSTGAVEDESACGRFNAGETSFLTRVTELMESTGKPIINVPLRPLEVATFRGSGRYDAVILYSPVAAIRALGAMAWYGDYIASHQA
jgi:acyl-CoA synthetase (NDP forming)